jgi:hypothetical protein
MFAILQSLQDLSKKNIFYASPIENHPKKNSIKNKDAEYYKNISETNTSDKQKLYIKDSIEKSIEKINKNKNNSDLYFDKKDGHVELYYYFFNSIFFFGLGAYTFSKMVRK